MVLTYERVQRVWSFHPASYPLRAMHAGLRGLFGGPRLRRMLLISDGGAYTSEQQFAPIRRHARLLSRRFGLVVQHRKLPVALALDRAKLSRFDLVGLKLQFRTVDDEADRIARHFAAVLGGTATQLIYFDGDDDLNVQWHGVMEVAQLYVKKHAFADDSAYAASYVGKSNLTDYVARYHGVPFSQDIIPASGGLPAEALPKLHLGWNIALDDKIVELSRRVASMPALERDIDIACRAYVKPEVWTHALRNGVLERMEAMAGRWRILAPRDRVAQDRYYEEMLRSRICVSPFGFGEICWRDFEAILCGCLLVKPDMGHVRTQPNVYIPGVTYAPVRWDYADLEEVSAAYLHDEDRRVRMVQNARRALLEGLEPSWFADRFGEMLAGVNANEVSTAAG